MSNHVEQIVRGTKTQTRRQSGRYEVGGLYSIQPKRAKRGIPDGKILIIAKRKEVFGADKISALDAEAEGGYDSEEFEALYRAMYPSWTVRYAYTFKFIPKED